MHENNIFDGEAPAVAVNIWGASLIEAFIGFRGMLLVFRWNFVHLGVSEECGGNIRGPPFDIFKRNRTAGSRYDRAKYFSRVGDVPTNIDRWRTNRQRS